MRLATLNRHDTMVEQEPHTLANSLIRRRILVVDHDDDIRLSVCSQLAQWGFEAEGEDNGVSGLARLAQIHPATAFTGMLLEMDMPVLGGMAVLQEMKDRHPTIPVIVMARTPHIDKLRNAVRLWAQEYIVKPFDPELLKLKCAAVFSGRPHRT
jgi:DNA-binding NtrC family response regulator